MASSTLTYREGTTNRRWVLVNPRWLMHVSQYAVAGPTGANFDKMIKQVSGVGWVGGWVVTVCACVGRYPGREHCAAPLAPEFDLL